MKRSNGLRIRTARLFLEQSRKQEVLLLRVTHRNDPGELGEYRHAQHRLDVFG
ncbi:MAG: hypothetical protein M3Z96_04285 [Pseudomonadota bacterium]|nr:hypothetical protein [Pseudomonadota bacterium]